MLTGQVCVHGSLVSFVELLDGRDGGMSGGIRVDSIDPVAFLANITSVFPQGLPDTCIGFRFYTKFIPETVMQGGERVLLDIPSVNVEHGLMYRIGERVDESYVRAVCALSEDEEQVILLTSLLAGLARADAGAILLKSRGRTPTKFRYDFVSEGSVRVIDATGKPVTEIATPPTVPPSVLDGNVLHLRLTKTGPVVTRLDHNPSLDKHHKAQIELVFDADTQDEVEGYERRLNDTLSHFCVDHYSSGGSGSDECRHCGRRIRDGAGRIKRTDILVLGPGMFHLRPGARFAIPVGDSDSVEISWNGYALRLPEPKVATPS